MPSRPTSSTLSRLVRVSLLAAVFAVSSCSGGSRPEAKTKQGEMLSVPYPPVQPVADKTTLTCMALMEADLTGSPDTSLTKGIEGKITSGQNGVTVTIGNDGTVRFASDAAAQVDATTASTFTVVANNKSQLVASLFDGQSMNSLVINKASGLAIWSKTRSTFPLYDAPTASASYMVCR